MSLCKNVTDQGNQSSHKTKMNDCEGMAQFTNLVQISYQSIWYKKEL